MKSVILAPKNCPYDVDDILTTMNKATPSERWPGTSWVQITDCMLRAADASHPAGSAGGAWEVTQTEAQMPRHRHLPYGQTSDGNNNPIVNAKKSGDDYGAYLQYGYTNTPGHYIYTEYAGSGQPMPIVNKYIACYIWQRTA